MRQCATGDENMAPGLAIEINQSSCRVDSVFFTEDDLYLSDLCLLVG